jgi:hypothetical protein
MLLMVRLCGACLGLFAFSIAIIQGLMVDNPTETTLVRGVEAMFAFCVIGLGVGWVAQRILDEHTVRRNGEMFKVIEEEEEESSQQTQTATSDDSRGEPTRVAPDQVVAGA